jgi:NAD(P)-dependent dehydrogenase (short-subunit alcohol dehydrogenase family)
MTTLESFSLKERVALITGGARHLGLDMAFALAEAGAGLVITSRTLAHAEQAAEQLQAAHSIRVLPLSLDVCDPAEVQDRIEQAHGWQGRIDILINNAGGSTGAGPTDFFERTAGDMDALIRTNLLGAMITCQGVGRIMAAQGHGKIINIASIAALVGRDRRMYSRNGMRAQPVDYAAAKAGVIGFTRDLAAYLAPYNVHVNCISPGGFERGQPEGFVNDYSDRTPLGRMGRDGIDLKAAALFLSSPASDYITGHNLVVDGGFSTWQ